MGSGARRIHTEFEREVVERLERIEKRLEHAGLHIPCLLDTPMEEYTAHKDHSSGLIVSLSGPRLVPDENESYGYIDDRGEVGMQDFDGSSA